MHITFFRDRLAIDGSLSRDNPQRNTIIREGRYEVERVPNPYGCEGEWIVLKGTLIGATEESLRDWMVRPGEKKLMQFEGFELVVEE